jgi:superfamily II DNA/RNA helicase
MDNFTPFGLPEALYHTLQHMQFTTPTPIQAQAIPLALEGKDILGSAQTGTGKTGAFGIPLVARLMNNPRGSALVMTPTRELATQVLTQLKAMLGKSSKIKTALLIGGDSMPKQLQQLRSRPRLIVGTPGRINDHLERGNLMLHDTGFLVLDETDRMLDMGFTIQIERIMKFMTHKRQTMLFSATLPKNIERIAAQYLNDPVRISVSNTSAPAANITHDMVRLKETEKAEHLLSELDSRKGSIIIFMKTKHATEKMATRLSKAGHSADAIHGDLRQSKRDRVIANFRNKKYRILVATDIAARGLDIPHIEHVINYDLPQCAEDYIHRIGRTARAGAEGSALCMVTPSDTGKWHAINRLMDPEAAAEAAQKAPRNHGRRDGASAGAKRKPFKGNNNRKRFNKKPKAA